jgi:hypothetical protein
MAWKSSTSPFVPCAGFETQTPGINVKACEFGRNHRFDLIGIAIRDIDVNISVKI